jgi:hypothetical protein
MGHSAWETSFRPSHDSYYRSSFHIDKSLMALQVILGTLSAIDKVKQNKNSKGGDRS